LGSRQRQIESKLKPDIPNFLMSSERVALFIDGTHILSVTAALEFQVDFKRLLEVFREQAQLVQAAFYVVATDANRALITWLDYNGFHVVAKPGNEEANSWRAAQSATHVELAVDALQLASAIDHIVIVAGKSEFKCLVASLQQTGKRVTVLSSIATYPPMVSDELRRQADQFVDLSELKGAVQRD
jgi:uncharacterized LabA/DUF88 family protein